MGRIFEWFVAAWRYPILSRSWGIVILVVLGAGLCLARACIGLMGTQIFSHDAFMLLDGGWRMLNGQRPHIDFYSHVGLLTYAPTAICLWLLNGRAEAFGYAQGLTGLVLGIWAFVLSRKRLPDMAAAVITLAVVLITVDPSALGFQPFWIGPAMTYNRCGYALIALLLMEAIAAKRLPSTRGEFWGGLSTGSALATMLFLKITYFAAGCFLLVLLIPCRVQRKQRWFGVLAGFAAFSVVFCSYLRFNLKPMWTDLKMIAGAKHLSYGGAPHISLSWYMVNGIFQDALLLMAFALIAVILLISYGKHQSARSIAIASIAVCITGILLIFGNYEQNGFPLSVFLAILVIATVLACIPGRAGSPDPFHASVLLFGSTIVVAFFLSGALGVSGGLIERFLRAPHHARMQAPRLHNFITIDNDEWYTAYVNNGLSLLQKYRRPEETVMSLDFTNPFSYGLGIKPAKGGTTVFQYKTTFDDVHKPSPEWLFGHANLVMLPKTFSDPNLTDTVSYLYQPFLEKHFTKIAESADWALYRNEAPSR